MRQNLIDFDKLYVTYPIGSAEILSKMHRAAALEPFSEEILSFLNQVSEALLTDKEAKAYPDVVTFAFWIRRASTEAMKRRFHSEKANICRLGRGTAFHIAPSNVPVNYAYSLAAGLLCGNANIVRIPSKPFPQTAIINRALKETLKREPAFEPYIVLLNYGHDKAVNDALSSLADVRIIWGGDATIEELRKSPIGSRATEVTFADRYSMAVIDSDFYMKLENKKQAAADFYNDTYLTDQNACTSPRLVAWLGTRIPEAKEQFWQELHKLVEAKYELQGVQAVNKLTSAYLLAASQEAVRRVPAPDNLIVRMQVEHAVSDLMELKDNSGYFFETECREIMELREFCDSTVCQTVSYIGKPEMIRPLLTCGIKGIDRVVPVGKTMDFDFLWDGYDLYERLTRIITCR